MKRTLKKRKDEPLYRWIDRIAAALNMTDWQKEAMLEVSKESYIRGSNDAHEIIKTHSE